MKLFVVLFCLYSSFGWSQEPYYTFGIGVPNPSPVLTFEDTATTKYIYYEQGTWNLWETGMPTKVFFNDGYQGGKALLTDTNDTYPTNNSSICEFKIVRDLGYSDVLEINFMHKMQTSPGLDGGKIEISLDNGQTWGNIIDNTYLNSFNVQIYGTHVNEYTVTDQVFALTDAGYSGTFDWTNSIYNLFIGFYSGDTINVRFTFKTDMTPENNEGWMIDDLVFSTFMVGLDELDNSMVISPNPATSVIEFDVQDIEVVQIFTSNGRLVKEYALDPNASKASLKIEELEVGSYFIRGTGIGKVLQAKFHKN